MNVGEGPVFFRGQGPGAREQGHSAIYCLSPFSFGPLPIPYEAREGGKNCELFGTAITISGQQLLASPRERWPQTVGTPRLRHYEAIRKRVVAALREVGMLLR